MVRELHSSRRACACRAPLAAAPCGARGRRARGGRCAMRSSPSIRPDCRPAGAARRALSWSSQQNLQFHPFLTIVPVGADVSFPNFDPTKHHVYSFSPAKTLRAQAVRQGPVAHGPLRQARRGRARLQHPRPDERLHRRRRQRLGRAHQRAGHGGVRRCSGRRARGRRSGIPICARPAASCSSASAPGQRSAGLPVRLRPPPRDADDGLLSRCARSARSAPG